MFTSRGCHVIGEHNLSRMCAHRRHLLRRNLYCRTPRDDLIRQRGPGFPIFYLEGVEADNTNGASK